MLLGREEVGLARVTAVVGEDEVVPEVQGLVAPGDEVIDVAAPSIISVIIG